MKRRAFKTGIQALTDARRFEGKTVRHFATDRLALADASQLRDLVEHIVSNRGAVVLELAIASGVDRTWMACMGYFYWARNETYTFIVSSEAALGSYRMSPVQPVHRDGWEALAAAHPSLR